MSSQQITGIEIQTTFIVLAFFFFFCSPRIEINGVVHRRKWGSHFFELPEGEHKVTIYIPYFIWPRMGENSIDVDLQENTVVKLRFFMPPYIFAEGSLKVSK